MSRELGKWYRICSFSRDIQRMETYSRVLQVGLYKIHMMPEQGAMLQYGKHYKGFVFCTRVFWPFDIQQWR